VPAIPELFLITSPPGLNERATWDSSVDLEVVHCPLDDGHQRAGKRIGNLSVNVRRRLLDSHFVWTWQSECLVENRVAQALANDHLTGFRTRPARVSAGGVVHEHKFSELAVTGWGGVANSASGVRLVESCLGCGLLSYSGVQDWGRLFDGRAWDGSDLFMIWPLLRFIIATHRAATFIRRQRLTGVVVSPLVQMKGASEGLGPGRVSYWLDEGRLNQLSIDPAIR
jgi:hypothetical protein